MSFTVRPSPLRPVNTITLHVERCAPNYCLTLGDRLCKINHNNVRFLIKIYYNVYVISPENRSLDSLPLTRSQRRVLDAFKTDATFSCNALALHLGLTRTTVAGALKKLQKLRLIEQLPGTQGNSPVRGRPSLLYRLRVPTGFLGGITVGRRHICAGLANANGELIETREEAIALGETAGAIAARGNRLLHDLLTTNSGTIESILGIGLGLPGPIDTSSRIVTAKSVLPEWAGVDYLEMVHREFPVPLHILNDATLGLIGEANYGVAQGIENVIYLKVSTGIGAGILTQGHVYMGGRGTAGEIGHIPTDPHGRICHCGCRGCLETVASIPAVLSSLDLVLGDNPTPKMLFDEYRRDNRSVVRAVHEAAREIGKAVSMMCNLLNPDMVILGGRMPTIGNDFTDTVTQVVQNTAIVPNGESVQITLPALHQRSEIYGAIHIARQSLLP